MKTCPSPPAGIPPVSPKGPASITDAALAASEAVDQAARAERSALGVIPRLVVEERDHSMSLGTRRLYSDQVPPAPGMVWDRSLEGYDGSTPIACIEWNRVTFYREPLRTGSKKTPRLFRDQNLTRGNFNGYMSPATRRKVRRIASTWIRSIFLYRSEVKKRFEGGRPYPVFMTLTIPGDQVHTDKEINKACLQPFLIQIRRDYGIRHYFWRAEAQENGKLHYHLLIDRYVPKRYLQLEWNARLDALGYLGRYYAATGSLTPPSTEVHGIKEQVVDKKTGKVRNVDPVDYLVDYLMDTPTPDEPVTDAEGNEGPDAGDQQAQAGAPRRLIGRMRRPDGSVIEYVTRAIEGRVWGMSDGLREIREPRAEATLGLIQALEEQAAKGVVRRIDTEHATMYFGAVSLAIGRSHPGAWKLVKEHYLQTFGHLYPGDLGAAYLKEHPPMDPRNLWIDLEHFALWHRLRLEEESPVFATAGDLDAWAAEQAAKRGKAVA